MTSSLKRNTLAALATVAVLGGAYDLYVVQPLMNLAEIQAKYKEEPFPAQPLFAVSKADALSPQRAVAAMSELYRNYGQPIAFEFSHQPHPEWAKEVAGRNRGYFQGMTANCGEGNKLVSQSSTIALSKFATTSADLLTGSLTTSEMHKDGMLYSVKMTPKSSLLPFSFSIEPSLSKPMPDTACAGEARKAASLPFKVGMPKNELMALTEEKAGARVYREGKFEFEVQPAFDEKSQNVTALRLQVKSSDASQAKAAYDALTSKFAGVQPFVKSALDQKAGEDRRTSESLAFSTEHNGIEALLNWRCETMKGKTECLASATLMPSKHKG